MKPHLYISFLKFKIHSFHFFGVMGYIIGMMYGFIFSIQLQLEPLIILLMGGIGATIFFLLAFIAKWITKEETIVYYHHEIAILVFCSITLKLLHYPILPYIDITLLGIGTFLAFGRIGCFNVGCCHGLPGSFGYQYGERHIEDGFTWYYRDVKLLPVQLTESVFVFFIVITGSILLFQHASPGTVLILYTVVYGTFRFAIEFFRGDSERPYYKGLSEAQWTTLVLVTVSLALSFSGYLPFYNWHLIFFLLLTAVSLYVVFAKRKTSRYRLLHPKHIEEIATGLQHMKLEENNLPVTGIEPVNIYSTTEGLSFSSGIYYTKDERLIHYTLSSNTNLTLNSDTVNKIGKVICLIKKHNKEFDIVEKGNGVYHLIFKEEHYKEKSLLETIG